MPDPRSFFDSFKSFIWDIISYFGPGIYFLILVSIFVLHKYSIQLPRFAQKSETFEVLTLAYILGYIIYAYSHFIEISQGRRSPRKIVLKNIQKEATFKVGKSILVNKYASDSAFKRNLTSMDIEDLRNIAMGFSPESDQKVYTFMFRSKLCRHIAAVSLIIGIIGLLNFACSFILPSIVFFQVGEQFVFMYVLLIASSFLLSRSRDYFYRIAMILPFQLLISQDGLRTK